MTGLQILFFIHLPVDDNKPKWQDLIFPQASFNWKRHGTRSERLRPRDVRTGSSSIISRNNERSVSFLGKKLFPRDTHGPSIVLLWIVSHDAAIFGAPVAMNQANITGETPVSLSRRDHLSNWPSIPVNALTFTGTTIIHRVPSEILSSFNPFGINLCQAIVLHKMCKIWIVNYQDQCIIIVDVSMHLPSR